MTKLVLGVVDVPYGDKPKFQVRRNGVTAIPSITTGEVAEILEEKYHPMEIFFNLHAKEIADDLTESLVGTMESLLTGAPITLDPHGTATEKIADKFKEFLSTGEMEKLGYPGVPTKAAIAGVNHRLKHPYSKDNKQRPSFIDTGEYQASMRAWIER